jgi:hypothetical protein
VLLASPPKLAHKVANGLNNTKPVPAKGKGNAKSDDVAS